MIFRDLPPSSSEDAFQIARRGLEDELSYFGRTGKAHFVDVRMLCDGTSRAKAEADDDVDYAIRNSYLLNQFAQPDRAERGLFRGFQDHRVAARECRRDFRNRHHQWKIPRIAEDARTRSLSAMPTRKLSAGAVLIREWQGTSHQVTVLEGGVLFRGKRHAHCRRSRVRSPATAGRGHCSSDSRHR